MGQVTFNGINSGNYYVVIRHRNHLDIISNDPVSLPTTTAFYFTNPMLVMGGANQLADLGGNNFGMIAGDTNGEGIISVADFNLYVAQLPLSNLYTVADFNFDGNVTVDDFNAYVPNASRIGVATIRYITGGGCLSGIYDCLGACDGNAVADVCGVCNGSGELTWYIDEDGDGLGNPNMSQMACEQPTGYVANANDDDDQSNADCPPQEIQLGPTTLILVPSDLSDRGACEETLSFTPQVDVSTGGPNRTISSNSIPEHMVGLFGNRPGALNPNTIQEVNETYRVPLNPTLANTTTDLLSTQTGPAYALGVLLNGVLLDPVAAEPFPHEGLMSPNLNWEWNLDAMIVDLGLDCNNAHVQPTGQYHYHGPPSLYLEALNSSGNAMELVGYTADGFPIYYKYAYSNPDDANSVVTALISSHVLKLGERPGDGMSAPCGAYNGVYSNDWVYTEGFGDLDECNGRTGVTPEHPDGTYYYVITDDYPFLPRCFKGTPSNDFKLQ